MIRIISIFTALLFFSNVSAQFKFNFFEGVGKWHIGTSLDTSDGRLTLCINGRMEEKGSVTEYYQFKKLSDKVMIDSFSFSPVFNFENGKLESIWFSALYTYEYSPRYKEKAQADFDKLIKYFTDRLDQKRKKKTFMNYPTQRNEGYRWKSNGLALDLVYVSNPKDSRAYPFVNIELHSDR